MYYGSEEFNNAIENTQGNALKTRLKFSDEEIIELVSSMRYYGGSNDTDDLTIGNIAMAYVEVSAFTNKMLTGREFLLESGVKLSDGTYEYAPIGYFTVQTPNGDYDEVTFTAYDRMIKFEKVYSSNLTYPTDSAKVLNEICSKCGVALATPITSPITITENLKGYTCREVLGYIAGIHGFFACIDRYGKLNLRWYSDTPIEKSLRYVWSFEKSQEQYEVEKIEVAKDSETAFTSGNGIITLHHSNPYATQDITNKLYAKLGGYSYTPSEVEILDDIRLDPWDVVSVTYYDDISYIIPCMSIEHDFGATSTTVKAFGKTSNENEYRFTGPTIKYLNRMATDLLVANRVIATKVDAEYVQAHAITVDNLDAIKAEIQQAIVGDLSADFITVEVFDAEKARIDKLETNKLDADDLSAEVAKLGYATITQLNASNAKIEELQTDRITATEVKANYADIKLANVAVADIGTLFAEVGLLDRATIVNGHVTGYLDAVEINANKITAGTLAVDRLVFRGTKDSIVYELNNITGALQAVQGDTLNGEILTDRSITVDKIVAHSITANEIASKTITANELAVNSVTAEKILAGAITANKLAVNSVTAEKILAGAITANKLAVDSVTAEKILAGAITANKIATGAITAEKLDVETLSAISANLGTVKAGIIQSSNYAKGSAGMQLNLTNGVWNGKYFNIDSSGKMSATGGKLGNWNISKGLLYEDGITKIEIKPPTDEDGEFIALSIYDKNLGDYVSDSYWGVDGKGYGYIYTNNFSGTSADIQQIDATTVTTSFLDVKQDITVKGDNNILAQDYVCHTMNAGSGSAGYWRFARITVTKTYANAPIEFTIIQRTRKGTLQIILNGTSTATTHTLNAAWQSGRLQQIYVVSVGSGVFDLYLTKQEAYDSASVTALQMSAYMRGSPSGVDITWYNEYVASVPSRAIKAEYVINEAATAAHYAKVSAGYDDTGNYELTAANLRCNGWLRSNVNTGWYNQTHGGGVFMQDTTWVRTYGSKGFSCDQTIRGKAVTTEAGANLDTLEEFRKYFEFTNRKKLSFMGYAYGDSNNYGFTIRWGNSSIGSYVDDTYWLSMGYDGSLRIGVQINNASQPTWHTK